MTQSHMAREVAEIPAVTAKFLSENRQALNAAAKALKNGDFNLVVTVARGSSDHAATYLKYAIELEKGLPVASIGPSIASIYKRSLRLGWALCIGISQSGRSPDIVEMMRSAKESGARTLAISNFADSPLALASDFCFPLQAGAEQSVAATKTFVTSVVAGLALLAYWRDDPELIAAVEALPSAFEAALAQDWSPLVERLSKAQSAYLLGRGPAFAIACEAALKLKETCGLHAEAFSAAEVLHGPSAIVAAGFPVIALGVQDEALPPMIATVRRLSEQGADVFLTGAEVPGVVTLPSIATVHPLIQPIILAVSFYRMVEILARRRGYNPDMPPHLHKVTETV